MKNRYLLYPSIILFILSMFFIGGCQSSDISSPVASSGVYDSKASINHDYKVVVIMPGSIDDQGWNATAYDGIKLIESEFGVRSEYIENVPVNDAEVIFKEYGKKKYDLVFGHGVQFEEAARKVSKSYPNTFFMIINSESGYEPNVGGVGIREWEGGYVAGVLAALNSKSKHVSAIGSLPLPVIEETLDSFVMGVKSVDADIKVDKAYLNTWGDIRKGRQMAQKLIDEGSDVLFCTANEVGLGVIEAARKNGVKAVGYIAPQNNIAPDTVISSITYSNDKLYSWVANELIEKRLKARGYSQGWSDGVLKMQWSDSMSDQDRRKIESVIKQLSEGKISNPYKLGD